jgi:hypothetical protein
MKKSEITSEFIMDYWLKKYHNITVAWLLENEPELIKSPDWYEKYAVTQEQHDEWYNWAIDIIAKTFRLSKKTTKRNFVFDYLNLSPSVITQKQYKKCDMLLHPSCGLPCPDITDDGYCILQPLVESTCNNTI